MARDVKENSELVHCPIHIVGVTNFHVTCLEIQSIWPKSRVSPQLFLNWKFEDMKPTSMKPQQNVGMSVYSICHQHPLFTHINNQSNISQRPLQIGQVGRLEQRLPLLEDGLVNEQHMSLCTCHSLSHTHTHLMASMDIWGAFVKDFF
jgi:hypothetical protein